MFARGNRKLGAMVLGLAFLLVGLVVVALRPAAVGAFGAFAAGVAGVIAGFMGGNAATHFAQARTASVVASAVEALGGVPDEPPAPGRTLASPPAGAPAARPSLSRST